MNARNITKLIIAVIVIGPAAGYLLYGVVESSLLYCCTVDEFVQSTSVQMSQNSRTEPSTFGSNRIIRLIGRVENPSLIADEDKMRLDFELAGQKNSISVRYHGIVPENFIDGKEVFVEGTLTSDGVFQASKILTRCESKYDLKR